MNNFGVKYALFWAILPAFLLVSCAKITEPQTVKLDRAWILETGLCEPETVVLDPVRNDLIVSNICGFKANGQGYLSRLSLDGQITEEKWVSGLNAPAGMAILDRILAVTDLDRVQLINLDTGEIVNFWIPETPGKAFNDLAVDREGNFYVSDSAQAKVFKIEHGNFTPFPDPLSEFEFANGLHVDEDILYVGGKWLWQVDMKSKKVDTLYPELVSDIDGIEIDKGGDLNITIVGGDIWHLSANSGPQKWVSKGLSSTNHAFLPEQKLVIIPTGYDNTVLALRTPNPT